MKYTFEIDYDRYNLIVSYSLFLFGIILMTIISFIYLIIATIIEIRKDKYNTQDNLLKRFKYALKHILKR